MRRSALFAVSLAALLAALAAAPVAQAQLMGLYYKEEVKDGRVYVFNTPEAYKRWQDSGEMGVAITLVLSGVTMCTGLAIGTLGAAAQVYGRRWLQTVSAAYVEVIRNTPLIVQLFLIFFGLPSAGIRLDAMTAAIVALTINLGAYATEIIRAGLEAIPRAQIEAGHSLGLSGRQVFRHVVLVPAVRIVYPALTSQFVLVMLATSVVSQISAQSSSSRT